MTRSHAGLPLLGGTVVHPRRGCQNRYVSAERAQEPGSREADAIRRPGTRDEGDATPEVQQLWQHPRTLTRDRHPVKHQLDRA